MVLCKFSEPGCVSYSKLTLPLLGVSGFQIHPRYGWSATFSEGCAALKGGKFPGTWGPQHGALGQASLCLWRQTEENQQHDRIVQKRGNYGRADSQSALRGEPAKSHDRTEQKPGQKSPQGAEHTVLSVDTKDESIRVTSSLGPGYTGTV